MANNDLTSTLTSTGMKGGKQIILSESEKMAAGCGKLDWKMEKAVYIENFVTLCNAAGWQNVVSSESKSVKGIITEGAC